MNIYAQIMNNYAKAMYLYYGRIFAIIAWHYIFAMVLYLPLLLIYYTLIVKSISSKYKNKGGIALYIISVILFVMLISSIKIIAV